MTRWTSDQQPPASNGATDDPGRFSNLWKRVISTQPKVASGASMWALYMAGVLMIIVSMFIVLGAFLLVVGEIGAGWQGRVGGGVGVLAAVFMFLVGRWMTGATEPRA